MGSVFAPPVPDPAPTGNSGLVAHIYNPSAGQGTQADPWDLLVAQSSLNVNLQVQG